MKKLYTQRLVHSLLACILLPATLFAQTLIGTTTVYTPKGTGVSALRFQEMTDDQKVRARRDVERDYPLAQPIADASQQYNCHAYAWHIPNNPYAYYSWVWLETPGDDAYWQDGSYIEVCNDSDSEATKISYWNNGDHSAVRSTVAGKYDSKWGPWPLMRHDPAYGPVEYNMNYRKYYVST